MAAVGIWNVDNLGSGFRLGLDFASGACLEADLMSAGYLHSSIFRY